MPVGTHLEPSSMNLSQISGGPTHSTFAGVALTKVLPRLFIVNRPISSFKATGFLTPDLKVCNSIELSLCLFG